MPDVVDTQAPAESGAAASPALRFTIGSRTQRRFANTQTVSNLAGATSFQPIQLPATGFNRKVSLFFNQLVTSASAGAVVAGDGPWNLISNITITDATGQAIFQPVSGYNLYLINKYLSVGAIENTNRPDISMNPQMGPEYAFASTATTGTASFRLDLDFEQDCNSGYGSIPNLDSNASLQLKIDVAASTVAFTGTTTTVATLSLRVTQWYWAPVAAQIGNVIAETQPVGFGDYVETRFETGTATPSAENLLTFTNRGGQIKGLILISRAAGVRTAITAASPVGLLLDNNAIDEGVLLEEIYDYLRRVYCYLGTDLTTSYAPLTAGVLPGLDRGVIVWPEFALSGGRDSWMTTRVGSLWQAKVTPGASASSYEAITQIAQVRDSAAFYDPSALN
jgi:hypothetical protein